MWIGLLMRLEELREEVVGGSGEGCRTEVAKYVR